MKHSILINSLLLIEELTVGDCNMFRYIVKRIISLLPTLLVVAVVVFLIAHLTPGDPAAVMLGPDATPEQVAQLRQSMGLDEPLIVQFVSWLSKALRGDLGQSIFLATPVVRVIADRAEPTITLALLSLVVAILIGIPVGIVTALKRGTIIDQIFGVLGMLAASMPTFWFGLNLMFLFAVRLSWFPAVGYEPVFNGSVSNIRYLVLPALALGFPHSGMIMRIVRSSLIDVLSQDYIRTAKAKGLSLNKVVMKHAFKNAAIPIVTVVGLTFALLLGGAVVTESVFSIPGVGRLVVTSVLRRDYPVIQGAVLIAAFMYALINLAIDIVYMLLDPRVEY